MTAPLLHLNIYWVLLFPVSKDPVEEYLEESAKMNTIIPTKYRSIHNSQNKGTTSPYNLCPTVSGTKRQNTRYLFVLLNPHSDVLSSEESHGFPQSIWWTYYTFAPAMWRSNSCGTIRGVGRSRILGGGRACGVWASAIVDNQKKVYWVLLWWSRRQSPRKLWQF